MCIFCGGQCGSLGQALAPAIGISAALVVIKVETSVRRLIRRWKK